MNHHVDEEIWAQLEALEAELRAGRLPAAEYRSKLQALWQQLRTDEDGSGEVLQQILTATASEVQGQMTPGTYRDRIQSIWDRWLAGSR